MNHLKIIQASQGPIQKSVVFDLSDIFDILCYIFAHNGDEPFKDY